MDTECAGQFSSNTLTARSWSSYTRRNVQIYLSDISDDEFYCQHRNNWVSRRFLGLRYACWSASWYKSTIGQRFFIVWSQVIAVQLSRPSWDSQNWRVCALFRRARMTAAVRRIGIGPSCSRRRPKSASQNAELSTIISHCRTSCSSPRHLLTDSNYFRFGRREISEIVRCLPDKNQ